MAGTVLTVIGILVAIASAVAAFLQAREARQARRDAVTERVTAVQAARDAAESQRAAAEAAQQSAGALADIAHTLRPRSPWQLRWAPDGDGMQELVNRTGRRVEASLVTADPDAYASVYVPAPGFREVDPDSSIRFRLNPVAEHGSTFALRVLWGDIGDGAPSAFPVTAYYDRSHRYPGS